jgi:predicted DNA-binding transcriptional regulator AlpA
LITKANASSRRLGDQTVTSPLESLPADIARHRILNTEQTAAFIGFSIPHTRRLYRDKKMPEPLKLSERKLGWRVGDLVDWLAARSAT